MISIIVFMLFSVISANGKDIIDRRGITADELNKRKSDQDVKESNKRDYYYVPSDSSNYGRPHFTSSGYDSTGVSSPNYDTNYPYPDDYPHHQPHYKPSSYDHALAPQYPPTGHTTTTIAKPINIFALKSILIPIAGLAILGAAAALSTNPVLLQLGVVKGRKRKRRSLIVEMKRNNGKRF